MNQAPEDPVSEQTDQDAAPMQEAHSTDAPPPWSPSAPGSGAPPALPDVWVRYDARPNTPLPVYEVGRYWHAGTHYRLSALEAASLDDVPGFVRE